MVSRHRARGRGVVSPWHRALHVRREACRDVDRYLLGIDDAPEWLFKPSDPTGGKVATWWASRWASARAKRDDVSAQVRHEGLAHPIRHRARVRLPDRDDGQGNLLS